MSKEDRCPRLQTFLFSLVALLKEGKSETCARIDENLESGIATYLLQKYPDACKVYEGCVTEIDRYFQDQRGCAEDVASDFFKVQENDGLWALLTLAIDHIK